MDSGASNDGFPPFRDIRCGAANGFDGSERTLRSEPMAPIRTTKCKGLTPGQLPWNDGGTSLMPASSFACLTLKARQLPRQVSARQFDV
jgi:hypothetical protein